MSVRSAQSITTVFTTRRFDTGVATNADSLPTGTLYVNGTADGAVVTVTNITTGLYKAALTLPTLALNDVVDLRINATVNAVADNGIIWSDTKDFFAGCIPDVIAGGANGLVIAGSNAATTFAGLTTGALSCTTITASGAVAFQSTFAVTTSTSLAALSATTVTFSGAVAFQSTFAVTTSTSLAALSCTTLTASGAVAFQSTFATTGTTTFNAFTVTNALTVSGTTSLAAVTTSGTVTFNAFTVTNAFTVSGATTLTGAVTATNAGNDIRGVALAANQHVIVDSGTVTTVTNQLTAAQIATGIWQDAVASDFTAVSSIGKSLYTTGTVPGASGGLLIAGSNAATTFSGLTTGALSCTTITASGAVAFQSTFAVTTSTSLAALSCTTLTAGGAVAFQSTFVVTGSTTLTGTVTATNASNDIRGIALTSAYDFAKGTVAMTESYAADNVAPTPAQALFLIQQSLHEFAIAGTTRTVKQ